ncbi:Sterol 3-beta-glucosyltransferase [Mortierella claussenii]|nr:Sterol 3-beta-glucosyltransferase [Mortierella claussenii]
MNDYDSSSDEEEDEFNSKGHLSSQKDIQSHRQQDLTTQTDPLKDSPHHDTHSNAASQGPPSDPSPIVKVHHTASDGNTHTDSHEEKEMGTASGFSIGTVHDKEVVAQKLQKAFGYSKDEALIKGYMYLTTNHVCFYANLPSSHDVVQKEGFFSKKSKNTKKFNRYWFILKNDVLSSYADQTDIYYPIKTIDLRDALSAEPSPKNDLAFYVYMTSSRKYKFKTDSELARTDWVKAIQKSIFHAKMNEDSVKISIPLANILTVEMNTSSFAETIRISVKDNEDIEDEFFFAYFDDTPKVTATLQSQVDKYSLANKEREGATIMNLKYQDTTSTTADDSSRKSLASEPPQGPLASSVSDIQSTEDSTQPATSTISWLNPLKYLRSADATVSSSTEDRLSPSPRTSTEAERLKEEVSEKTKEEESDQVPSTFSLRGTAARIAGHAQELTNTTSTTIKTNKVELGGANQEEVFRKEFSLPEGEALAETYTGYLLRFLPLYGKIYLSDNYICFKSTMKGSSTRVVLPLADVEHVDKHHGTRFYFHGLALVTRLEDEIFFEFSNAETRATVMNALRKRITPEAQERRKEHRAQAVKKTPSMELDDPMESRVLDSLNIKDEELGTEPMSLASHPGFKPSRPLHITCLTIGSRGDVQPYIALCKRLMEDGHKCRIATHSEYKDWIESHGIEFGHVGGDPSELIELCVENGMFTVSFIREGLSRFRGWMDDLMNTAWEACQNTDVIIESPSAMAGIHIAEALNVPYFRAFPFPWTRTRAFPHPFAVPERNLGRGYNYMSYAMIEQVFWKGISSQVNRWRKKTLGIGSTTLEKMEVHRVPSLYSWSPSLVPAPMDWHSWVHVTGYWFLDNPDLDWTPPEGLEEFLVADPENKPVYIGFGSMVVSDPESMTKTIVDAIVDSGVRAIVSKGWSDKLSTQEDGAVKVVQNKAGEERVYPSSVYMLTSVPHDWLFPRLAGVVHHGGAGTTAAGLRAGIPTVIKPYFGDQHFWAQRIEDAGVGVWCHDLTVKKLSAALKTITTDEKMIKKVKAIGEKIRAEDGVGTAIQYFYHDLAIAKQHQERNKKGRDQQAGAVKDVTAGEEEEGATNGWISTLSPKTAGLTKKAQNEATKEQQDIDDPNLSETENIGRTARDGLSTGSEPVLQQNSLSMAKVEDDKDDDVQYKGSDREPLVDHLKPSATEPGPDRALDRINDSEKSAEDLAAELEAMQPPHDHPSQFTFHEKKGGDTKDSKKSQEKGVVELGGDAEQRRDIKDAESKDDQGTAQCHDQHHKIDKSQSSDGSSNHSDGASSSEGQALRDNKPVKKKSKARRMLGTIKMKAKKVKAHFKSSSNFENTDTKVVPLNESDIHE